jgi:hypothetical protein
VCTIQTSEGTVSVTRAGINDPAAWDACVANATPFACFPLCSDAFPGLGTVVTCDRVTAGDGGVDGGGADAHPVIHHDAGPDASDAVMTFHVVRSTHCGRRPAGLERRRSSPRGSLAGRWLARAAELEAASVPAFRRLAVELAAHGAPARLVEAARAAVDEEARHYALMARAARARGVEPRRPRVRPIPVRSLLAIARENAREGCVRETFGAMTAAFQARAAADGDLRAALATIARDEAGHARLAWEVDAWARAALPRRAARSVVEARRAEAARLLGELDEADLPSSVARTLGLPSGGEARSRARLAARLLWSA